MAGKKQCMLPHDLCYQRPGQMLSRASLYHPGPDALCFGEVLLHQSSSRLLHRNTELRMASRIQTQAGS